MRFATCVHRGTVVLVVVVGLAAVAARGQTPTPAVPPPPAPGVTDLPAGAVPAATPPAAEANASDGTPAGAEVLTRGPIHEAFAEPVVFNPQAGPAVPRTPPAPVEEMPPGQKPEGQNVVWIAGYWAWDDDRDDFLWVSGIWRDLPPGRQWVPGYWNTVSGGAQWVAGYWAPTEQDEARYLPTAPPESLETGPNIPAPDANSTWAPGHWAWHEERYLWRPGYWVPIRTDWVWVPAHYIWTPAGYVFVDGYWDHAIAQRGLIFAPVYFPPAVVAQPAFVYTPSVVIQNTVVVDHFFCRPAWNHYYFGDYYAPAYRQSGFFFALGFGSNGWGGRGFSFGLGVQRGFGGFYDPVVAQYAAVQSVTDVTYIRRVEQVYRQRVVQVGARPPRTFHAQRGGMGLGAPLADVVRARADIVGARADMVAARSDMVRSRSDALQARADVRQSRWETIDQAQRTEMARRADSLRDFRTARLQRETDLARTRADVVTTRQQAGAAVRVAQAEARGERARAIGDAREAARSARSARSPIAAAPLAASASSQPNRPEVIRPRGGAPAGNATGPGASPIGRVERPGGNPALARAEQRPVIERPRPTGPTATAGGDTGRVALPNRPGGFATSRPGTDSAGGANARPNLTRAPIERAPIQRAPIQQEAVGANRPNANAGRLLGDRSQPVRPGSPPAGWPSRPSLSPQAGNAAVARPGAPFTAARPGMGEGPARARASMAPRVAQNERPQPRRAAQTRPNRERRPD